MRRSEKKYTFVLHDLMGCTADAIGPDNCTRRAQDWHIGMIGPEVTSGYQTAAIVDAYNPPLLSDAYKASIWIDYMETGPYPSRTTADYCYGIRSERRLCEEVNFNLAYRWFCRLGLEAEVPDHSSFSKNRHGRFRDAETFRYVFEQVLQRCIDADLVKGEGFAVDAIIVKADASRQCHRGDDDDWGNGRAVREYIEALETDNVPTTRKLSPTDPAASYTAAPGGPAFYAYSANYLIDTDHGIIMDVEPSTANRTPEVETTKTMINRVEDRFGIKPKRLIGDTAYGTAAMLNWIVKEKQIEPHTPVWQKYEGKDGQFGMADFTWDVEADRYTCPAGKTLQRYRRNFKNKRTGITKDNTIIYRATEHDCGACEYKSQYCPKASRRKITRSIYESSREVARAVAQTPAYKKTRRQRKKVEMLFAHMKRILKLDRLRLRGMSGARDEFLRPLQHRTCAGWRDCSVNHHQITG